MKSFLLGLIMGVLYFFMEIAWRGFSHPTMIVVGGLAGVLIGYLNEKPSFFNKKMVTQCGIGTAITLVLEFLSGLLLNRVMGLNIWDYSHVWGNIMGQICLPFALLWFFICVPLAIWADDVLRHFLFGEEKPNTLLNIYVRLFTLK